MPKSVNLPLFDEADAPSEDPAHTEAAALRVVPQAQALLSPAAKAFNLQLTRIDKLKSQLQELQALGLAHRQARHQLLTPLEQRRRQCMSEMVLWLDARLAEKTLSAVQRQTAQDILCQLASALAAEGDTAMAALHDRHHPRSLAELEQDRQKALRAQLEEALGEPLEGLHEDASAEELLSAGMERLRQSVSDEQDRRREAAQARKARKKPGAARSKAQLQLEDADTTLRALFRQLASALHPDREPDAQERLRKTALMSEANAAYGRKDLVALMQIQQRALLADAAAASRLSDDKLAALTLLLKQQVAELERERASLNDRMAFEFDVPLGFGVTPKTLQMVLNEQLMDLEEELDLMLLDLQSVQDSAGLKRWLTQQRKETQRQQRHNAAFDAW